MLGTDPVKGGQEHDAESKELKAKQGQGEQADFKARGSPHIRLFIKAVRWTVCQTAATGKSPNEMVHKTLVQYWKERVPVLSPKQLEKDCLQLRYRRSRASEEKEGKYGGLAMAFSRLGAGAVIGQTLWTFVKGMETDKKPTGAAPTGPLEREASKCLAVVVGKGA